MNNKFSGFFVLVLFSLLLFNSSCKKADAEGVYLITSGEGKVYYDGIAFTTDLFFRCTVSNQSESTGTIAAWKCVYKSGNTELLEINSDNCSSFNMVNYANLRVYPYKERIIIGKSVPAIEKTLFSAARIPDNMDISVTITDDNSNQMIIHFNATVTFSEYND